MRLISLTLFLPIFVAIAIAQTPAPTPTAAPVPALPKHPEEIFAAAARLYDFSSPTLKPWHLKASYQLYDEKGDPTDKGTYEYWWASPDTYRSSWTRPGVEATDWHIQGKHYHLGTGQSLAFFERKMQSDLLSPLPRTEDLDPEKVRFDRQEEDFSGVKLPCVMVIHKMPLHAQAQVVPIGMFPTFCFDPQHPILRAYHAFGATSVLYNKVARVQGMFLPRELAVFDGKRRVLTSTIDSVAGLSPTAPDLTPSKDAIESTSVQRAQLSPEVAHGYLVKQVRPIYPQDAKSARIQGVVVLKALIGTDGRVHDLSVIDGPSPSLIGAAMLAVSQWEYKPYLLNGAPVEVETTLNVVFKLG